MRIIVWLARVAVLSSLLCLALLWTLVARAQGVIVDGQGTTTIRWTNASQWSDGSTLAPEDIESVTIFYGPTSRDGRDCADPVSATDLTCYPLSTEVTADGSTSTGIIIALTDTTTFYFSGVTKASRGDPPISTLSSYSAEVLIPFTLEIDNLKPMPPSDIEVQVEITCTTDTAGITCRFVVT